MQLVQESRDMGLPTRFLETIPADFVTIEFEDLHTYAAEYHPDDHRMVLNRTLSFNVAGSVLRPLRTLHHRDIGTLFHELFHAYMDYLVTHPSATAQSRDRERLLTFARDRQDCRYTHVYITPIVQRKAATESRELNERESWEALNETWGVFVGWAVWTKLEAGAAEREGAGARQAYQDWFARLQQANERGELRGYYEPEDEEERALTKKRYLSLAYRIAPDEARELMASVMEVSKEEATLVEQLLAQQAGTLVLGQNCKSYPIENMKNN
ncbi:hypothetical protein YTPLAS18_12460 [Nitrospira sp.]|nr:hypothetical protein YTPLAS18_12460 [Nitrospira sp.]